MIFQRRSTFSQKHKNVSAYLSFDIFIEIFALCRAYFLSQVSDFTVQIEIWVEQKSSCRRKFLANPKVVFFGKEAKAEGENDNLEVYAETGQKRFL